MTTINAFKDSGAQPAIISGEFRLMSKRVDWSEQYGQPRMTLHIGDFTGAASVIVPSRLHEMAARLRDYEIVHATIAPRQLKTTAGGIVQSIQAVSVEDCANIGMVMPRSLCPSAAQASLGALVDLLERIQVRPLRKLISTVLNTHLQSFLCAQGGWQYHHGYPGGLLVHSVAVALEAERRALVVYSHEQWRVELITTAALFHDLGKAVQLLRGESHPVRNSIPHNWLNLILLEEPLQELATEWAEGAKRLTSIFVWLAQSAAKRAFGHDAEFVHDADVLDVKCDRHADRQRLGPGTNLAAVRR